MSLKLRSETNCLNCGSEVTDHFCPHCGQANTEPRESFRHIMTHFITDYLHLDEKFFSSLKFLFLKPGFLTNEYNLGRRTKYVHPFRLYIFITVVFFIIQSANSHKESSLEPKALTDSSMTVASSDTTHFNDIDIHFKEPEKTLGDTTVEQYEARQASLPDSAKDSYIESYFEKKAILAQQADFNLNERIMENFKHNIPKMMFLMLPLFALILYVLFRKKKLFYVEHFYHSVFLHSFFYISKLVFLIPTLFLPESYEEYINFVFIIALGIYVYKSLRRVYEENGASTLLKLILTVIFYLIFLLILVVLNGMVSFLLL